MSNEQVVTPPVDLSEDRVLYARFPIRLRAMAIDATIIIGIIVAGLLLVSVFDSDLSGRVFVLTTVVVLLFYDPVFVSRTGATPGHRLMNLRVLDPDTLAPIGFPRALLRFWLKTVLGLLSFFFMAI